MAASESGRGEAPAQNIPVPDPSQLTTDAVREGILQLRTLLEAQIQAIRAELVEFKSNHEERHTSVVNAAIQHRKELSDASVAIVQAQMDAQFMSQQGQIKAVATELETYARSSDLRYQQRYDAQTQALDAAFEAQQKATASALAAAKEAVQTAMTSSQKAIDKAETATEKLMPRAEADSRLTELNARILRLNDLLEHVSSLSDRTEKNAEAISGLDKVTDAKFVTFRTLVDSQAEKVALALAASDRAVDSAFVSSKAAIDAAFQSSAQAIAKAESFNEKRFDIITKQIDELKITSVARDGAGAGQRAAWGYLVGVVGLAAAIIGIILAFNG